MFDFIARVVFSGYKLKLPLSFFCLFLSPEESLSSKSSFSWIALTLSSEEP